MVFFLMLIGISHIKTGCNLHGDNEFTKGNSLQTGECYSCGSDTRS